MACRALKVAVVTAALLTLAVSAAPAEVAFDGVAAGNPTASAVILWTRAENGGSPTELKAQIATDAFFANLVETRTGATSVAADFTLKLPATDPRQQYALFLPIFSAGRQCKRDGPVHDSSRAER